MKTYTTKSGDTWDLIAFNIYGAEVYMSLLMRANYEHLDTLIFRSGVVLNVPDRTPEMPSNLPFWREPRETLDAADLSIFKEYVV